MAVIHKGVDKIIDSSANEVVIATVKATIDNQVNKADVGHGHNIDDLTDVEVTGATAGQVLSFTMNLNGTGVPGWEPSTVSSSGGSGATNMGQLSDVDLTTTAPQSLDVLQYNGTQWEPATISGSGGGTSNVANLDDLTDVTATSPSPNQVLAWTGSAWEPANPATATAAVLTDAGVTFDNSSGDNEYIYGSAPQLVVNISAPQDGEGLVYQSGQWINGAVAGSGSVDLGIAVTTAGGDVDYEFNATTPSGVPSMDTSSLASGSTMMWNGSSWVDSGLIIESI
jgi:hypothetical protein